MKTVHITQGHPSLEDVLKLAREEAILLRSAEGESYLLSLADDFESEVELLRRNHAFLSFLDECKEDPVSIPLEELEKDLR